jgi:hypothetical protein
LFLKGNANANNSGYFQKFFEIAEEFPEGKWIAFKNFYQRLYYTHRVYIPASNYEFDKLYYSGSFYNDDYDSDKIYVDNTNIHETVVLQAIKGCLFLMASLGILDVAYDTPDFESIGDSCFSPYDEIQYFRLTPLGAFCLGKTSAYKSTVQSREKAFVLDNDNLFIRLLENCKPSDELILKEVAVKISANRYKVSPESFMKSCDSEKKIKDKIDFFKMFVSENPPEIWNRFFITIEDNINPIQKLSNLVIYKIKPNNKTLINQIATDKSIREIVTIAEGFKLLVEQKNVPVFKIKLKELGYFID